jgi:multidrug efflux pump subunit AcrA (membrane-fusion protein)
MPARVVTAGLAGRSFTGRTTRIVGQADITRNTLQVKVALEEPDPALRPEMLCRVEFLTPAASPAGTATRARQLWLPEAALEDGAKGKTTVWVVDPLQETVSPRVIEVAPGGRDGFRAVYDGLRPGEQVVLAGRDRLKPGARVAVSRN